MSVEDFPLINATLNGIATIFLVWGWVAIKQQRQDVHKRCMVAALVCSAAFLTCYLFYHWQAGSTPYEGEGALRYIYFFILATHVPLAALMTPFILAAVWFAYRQRFDRHVMITKWLWPVWVYVSITGVLIYVMLYPMGGSQPPGS